MKFESEMLIEIIKLIEILWPPPFPPTTPPPKIKILTSPKNAFLKLEGVLAMDYLYIFELILLMGFCSKAFSEAM